MVVASVHYAPQAKSAQQQGLIYVLSVLCQRIALLLDLYIAAPARLRRRRKALATAIVLLVRLTIISTRVLRRTLMILLANAGSVKMELIAPRAVQD